MPASVLGVDHAGSTASSLGRPAGLWRDVLGFDPTRPAPRPVDPGGGRPSVR